MRASSRLEDEVWGMVGYGRGSAGALVPVVQVSQDGKRQDELF